MVVIKNKITSADNREFLRSLKLAADEIDVEHAYKRIFQKRYIDGIQNSSLNRPYSCDGYLHSGEIVMVLRMLMEFKKSVSLTNVNSRARIIAQVVYYLKRFENDGKELPNVIFSGDEDEMFVVYAPVLYNYLKEDYDWSIAPSDAASQNLELVSKLNDDPNLSSFVFNINTPKFNINDVLDAIDSLIVNDGSMYKIKINEANIRIVFEEFLRMIFSDRRKVKLAIDPKKQPQLIVSLFIQSILGDKNLYPVPTKKNTLHLPNGEEIILDTIAFSAFFSRYERKYTVAEKDKLTAIADQLLEETARRFSGDFWTPTVWANRAFEMISETYGENWTDEYVVWDPACGTKNLTRDYRFKNLYSSTLHQEELDMSTRYNHDSVNFQYDFLNDDVDINPESDPTQIKMPIQLFNDLKANKPIIFYANPPYATANEAGAKGQSKKTVAKTKMNEIMKAESMGSASQQLYAQFFYRILKLKRDFNLTNVHIAFFSKTQFLSGGKYWKNFNDALFSEFGFEKGILFNAGEFNDVKDIWAITFSIYKIREVPEINYPRLLSYSVEQFNENGIEQIERKTVRMLDESEFLSEWLREPNKTRRDYRTPPYPQLSSAFNINEGSGFRGRLLSNAFGYFVSVANNVYKSQRDVFLLSGCAYMANGVSVTPENFERVVVTFGIRKSITHSWINDMDNLKKPDVSEINPIVWNEFVNDCMVYALFHLGASYQTSLSQVEYQGEIYDIPNEWFFASYEDVLEMAQTYYIDEIEEQIRFVRNERYVYDKLKNSVLSEEASSVYNMAISLLKLSFEHRQLAISEHPEWHLDNWDAGFYQIYKMVDAYKLGNSQVNLDLFKSAFKTLEEKIKERVYEFDVLPRTKHQSISTAMI